MTITKLLTVLTCGQSAALYGGTSAQLKYREQFTGATCAAASKQTLVGYGNFAPLLDASDVVSPGSFSKTAGRTNVYQADLAFNANGFPRVWEDSTALSRATSLADLDATAGRYFLVADDPTVGVPSTITVYVHATGDGNPASNGKVYEYNRRTAGVVSPSGMVVSRVATRRQLSNNGSFEIGQGSFATDITATDGTKHNALIHGGSTWRYVTLQDSYYNAPKILLVLNDNDPGNGVLNTTFEDITCVEVLQPGGVCLYGHVNSGGIYGTVTVKRVTSTGPTSAISGFYSTSMVVDGGTVDAGVTLGSSQNVLRNFTTTKPISIPYTSTAEIDTLSMTCGSVCTSGFVVIGADITPTVSIHDSTFSNGTAFDSVVYVSVGTALASFTLLRNTFTGTVPNNYVGGPGAANLPAASVIDGNIYHYPVGQSSWTAFRGTTYDFSNLTQWNAWKALGFDATGSRVTP